MMRQEGKIHPKVGFVIYMWFHFRVGMGAGYRHASQYGFVPRYGFVPMSLATLLALTRSLTDVTQTVFDR